MAEDLVQNEQEEIVEVIKDKKIKKTASSNTMDFGGLEVFYEKNKKAITYGGGALIALIAIFAVFKFYWLPEQEAEASNEAFFAQTYFEKDSFNIALNGNINVTTSEGPKTMMGFKDIADNYSMTKTGKLANYYSGICLLRTGKYAEAIEYLEKFKGKDEMLAPVAIGAIGDANMELNNVDEAVKFYLKAAEKSNNSFTTPIYLKKAAFAYEQKANYPEALALYERLKNEFATSTEAREVDKYIARVNVLSGATQTMPATAIAAPPTETASGTINASGNYVYNTGAETTITLPNGSSLMAGKNSTEYKLYSFLSDANAAVDNVDKTKGWIVLDRVYFENGKATLTAESLKQLENISTILKAYPNAKLKLGGYTDNTGSEAINVKISGERAETAMKAVLKNGVEAARLKSEGYGPLHPIASNDTPEGKAQNRRVDVRVTAK